MTWPLPGGRGLLGLAPEGHPGCLGEGGRDRITAPWHPAVWKTVQKYIFTAEWCKIGKFYWIWGLQGLNEIPTDEQSFDQLNAFVLKSSQMKYLLTIGLNRNAGYTKYRVVGI